MEKDEKLSADQKSIWKESIRSVYLYTIFFIMVYALWVGMKMGLLLSKGVEIAPFLKASHTHTLCNSFLVLFLLYDLRIKDRVENLKIYWGLGEIIVGICLLGHIMAVIGFSIAGLNPANTGIGMALVGIGEPILLLSLLVYTIVAIIAEMYR